MPIKLNAIINDDYRKKPAMNIMFCLKYQSITKRNSSYDDDVCVREREKE